MTATSARALARASLTRILEKADPIEETLARDRLFPKLGASDRAFARLLVATALRRLGQIDAALAALMERPLRRRDSEVRDILRLGTAQLLFLGTPAHAAVSTSLELASGARARPFKGLINAVLRRMAREGAGLVAAQDPERLNTPDWLWQSWVEAYGEETARRIARQTLAEPPLDLTVAADPEAWGRRLGARLLPTGSLRLDAPPRAIDSLAGYDEGAWWVQDAAAALPVHLLGEVRGRHVADLCAAPGGKTAQLAARGALVTAVDRSPRRLELLKGNLKRLRLAADCVAADVQEWEPGRPFDAVLLDAPCTATGTLRRHPDIAYLRGPSDVATLAAVQRAMLERAASLVRPGGLLVFATCSLQPEEGPDVVEQAIAGGAPIRRAAITAAEFGWPEALVRRGDLRTLPCHMSESGGLDGFHACRLVRDGATRS